MTNHNADKEWDEQTEQRRANVSVRDTNIDIVQRGLVQKLVAQQKHPNGHQNCE